MDVSTVKSITTLTSKESKKRKEHVIELTSGCSLKALLRPFCASLCAFAYTHSHLSLHREETGTLCCQFSYVASLSYPGRYDTLPYPAQPRFYFFKYSAYPALWIGHQPPAHRGLRPGGEAGSSPEHWTRLFSLSRLDSFCSFFSIPNLQPLQVTAPGGCMAKKRCKFCRCLFTLTKRNPDQMYCSKPDCQKTRKRRWQKKKMLEDEAYRLNQKDAQRRWTEKTPDYWKITGKTIRITPWQTGKNSDAETVAGGPPSPFPESLQRWTRYQFKATIYQGFMVLFLSRICWLQRWTRKS